MGPLRPGATFTQAFVEPWLTPFAVAVGIMTLVLFAHLAAVFLTLETDDADLVEDFRVRALWSGAAAFAAAFAALALASEHAPLMGVGLIGSSWALPFHLATGAAAVGVLAALWWRRYHLARVAVGAQVSLIVWGWALSQYPYLVPPDLTVAGAAAPAVTLRLVLIVLALGAVVAAAVAGLPVPRVQGRTVALRAAAAPWRSALMMEIQVHTERLDITPLALDEIDALIDNDGGRLRELTGVLFPRPAAPPPYMADPLPEVRERLRLRPSEAPWWNWLMFERETMRAVGLLAFAGPPDDGGC